MKRHLMIMYVLICCAMLWAGNGVQPIGPGETLPSLKLKAYHGGLIDVTLALKERPAVIIFYRGGWCPYCNMHLRQINELVPKSQKLGYQVLAISPDKPKNGNTMVVKEKLDMLLLSDSDLKASDAFGLTFQVDASTLVKYRKYGIDLNQASGRKHNKLPIPGVFIVNSEGRVEFAYYHPDYRLRATP